MYNQIPGRVYKLITNDGEYLINSHPTTLQMAEYMTLKVKSGMAISDITFRVIPFQIQSAREVLGPASLY